MSQVAMTLQEPGLQQYPPATSRDTSFSLKYPPPQGGNFVIFLYLFLWVFIYFFSVYVCFTYLYVCAPQCVPGAQRSQKKVLDHSEL